MKLSICVHQFFDQYLFRIKGCSEETRKAYRDVFKLFLPYSASYHQVKIESLKMGHLSLELILEFLDDLMENRGNSSTTRNHRLACLKSFFKMIRLFYPEHKQIADRVLDLPLRRTQKKLVGFIPHEQVMKIFKAVDFNKREGFRDYTILNLLYDSGARASEVATLNLDYFAMEDRTLMILGKGNRFRRLELWQRTAQLIHSYIENYRREPKLKDQQRLFINQRGEEFSRHGIYRICKKYLAKSLSQKERKFLNPVHSLRHSCAINMLCSGYSITDIKNRLGHEYIQSTMVYLKLNLSRKREINKKFMEFAQTVFPKDPRVDDFIEWENKEEILKWLDSL